MNIKSKKSLAIVGIILLSAVIIIISVVCVNAGSSSVLPSEEVLTETLDKFSDVIKTKSDGVDIGMGEFARKIETAGKDASPEELDSIVRNFYIDNIKLSYAAYYDAESDTVYVSPSENKNSGLTKIIFESVSFDEYRTILYGPIFSKEHGVVCAFVHPVTINGKITGIAAAYCDPVAFVTDSALECGGLNGLGPVIIDSEGIIFYSPFATEIGSNAVDFDSKTNIASLSRKIVESESGISGVFEGYMPGIWAGALKKQIAWKTIHIFNKEFRVGVSSCEKIPEISADYKPDYEAMEKAVRDVYVYAYEHGKQAAIKALNDGTFSYDNFDIFAAELDGTVLASQKRPYQVNLNFINYRSAYGIKIIETWSDIVQTTGGGYNYFTCAMTEDPTEDKGILTAAYLMLVDSDWYIGSMIPIQAEPVSVNVEVKNSALETMQKVLRMYDEEGSAAFEKYMNRAGTPLENDSHYIVVLDYDGNILASSKYPNHVGRNILSMSMPSTGISITRLMIMKAESGGGMITGDISIEDSLEDNTALFYVEPLDENSFVYIIELIGTHPKNHKGTA